MVINIDKRNYDKKREKESIKEKLKGKTKF
jgi:hypothetical protein